MVTSLVVKSSETELFRLSISDTSAVFVCDCDPHTTLHHTFFFACKSLKYYQKICTLAGIFTSKTFMIDVIPPALFMGNAALTCSVQFYTSLFQLSSG